jgi:hypothetical protein
MAASQDWLMNVSRKSGRDYFLSKYNKVPSAFGSQTKLYSGETADGKSGKKHEQNHKHIFFPQ